VGALRSLLERVPLAGDVPGLLAHWRWLGEWSLGCIGGLGDWRVETVHTLCQAGATTCTIEALTRHALPPDQHVRMAMEARPGEHKVERAKAQSAHELQQWLANPATLPGSGARTRLEAHGASEGSPAPDTTQSHPPNSRIERAARRDPVGEQVPAVRTKQCPFSGVVESAPQRFRTRGIAGVECPDGAARRSLVLRNGVLRFPSHDQRKTRTPQTERRWARQDTRWEVLGGESQPRLLPTLAVQASVHPARTRRRQGWPRPPLSQAAMSALCTGVDRGTWHHRPSHSMRGGATGAARGGATQRMAAVRLSQLQKHILRWLAADHQRPHGVIASSPPELVHTLQRDKGNRSHSLRTLERHGFLIIGRSSGGHAESLRLTPEGQKRASQLAESCDEESITIETRCCPLGCRVPVSLLPLSGALEAAWVSPPDTVGFTPHRCQGNRDED
jgi:hypothetical protein